IAQIASSDLATSRLAARLLSTVGRLVVSPRLGSTPFGLFTLSRSAFRFAATSLKLFCGRSAVTGSASQEASSWVRPPVVNAAGCTVSGPKVLNPLAVLTPVRLMRLSCQYAAPGPAAWAGRYRPVITNRTMPPLSRSLSLIVSPTCTRIRVAAVAGSAAGIAAAGFAGFAAGLAAPLAGGEPGHVPETRTACDLMSSNAVASVISVLPFAAGPEPAVNPSGSDQVA